jgi:signal transduction histidine kinase
VSIANGAEVDEERTADNGRRAARRTPAGGRPLSDSIGAVRAIARAASAEPAALDPASVADEAVIALRQITGLEACAILLADRAAGVARLAAQTGFPPEFVEQYGTIPLDAELLTARALRTGEPQYSGAVPPGAVTRELFDLLGGNTFIIIPFRIGGVAIGLISAVGLRDAPPTPDEIDLLQIVADQIGHAVRATELHRDGALSSRRAHFLADVSRAFNATLDLSAVLDEVARQATEVLGEWCAIYLREGDVMQIRAVHHQDPLRARFVRQLFEARPVRVGEGVAGTVVLTGEPRVFRDFDEHAIGVLAPRDEPAYASGLRQVTSLACLPLVSHGEGLGALVIATEGHPLLDDDLEFAGAFAEIAAGAIENARLYQEERSLRAFAEAAQARLEEADRQKDEFLSIASHELRTPLTSAQGFAQVMLRRMQRRGDVEPQLVEGLTTIETQLRRMASLLNDLLDFSRIQIGTLPLRPAPMELGVLIRTVAVRTAAMLEVDRIVTRIPPEPIGGNWDAARVDQIVSNLLENAVKYSPEGGPVEACAGQEDGWATVRVRDHGLGIPDEAMPHLFQRFYRVPDAAHQQINGIGIGLFICREIARRHGGDLTVERPDGPGSLFVLRLPLE